MKKYLVSVPDTANPDFISCLDELPLWSAPFGLSMLEIIRLKPGLKVLDIGCGMGFPLIELAQRLGNSCHLTGIDTWDAVLDRVRLKIKHYDLGNVEVRNANAEFLPFEEDTFKLIVSNNGLNNVEHPESAFSECSRVAAKGAQMVIAQNLEGTMTEFYAIFEKVLSDNNLLPEIQAMKDHIYQKRRPVHEVITMLEKNAFRVEQLTEKFFYLRFLDAATLFNHSLIRFWFAGSWKEIVPVTRLDEIFTAVEEELNRLACSQGEIKLSVPYVVLDCIKK